VTAKSGQSTADGEGPDRGRKIWQRENWVLSAP